MKKILPYLAVLTAMLMWSASGIATKIALGSLSPLSLVVVRFSLSVLLMLLIGCVCRFSSFLRLQALQARDIPVFLLAGLAQPFLYYILETYAYRYLNSPTIAEALLSTSPLLSPLFAMVLLRERVTRNNIMGILVSTLGVFVLIFVGANSSFVLGNPWGIALAFAAVSSAVIYTVVLKRIPTHYSPLSVVFYAQLISLLFFLPTWYVMDQPTLDTLATILTMPQQTMYAILYLAAGCSVISFILFLFTVRQLGVTTTNAFNNMRPVFTALIMLALFGEQLPILKWIGIILIIIGLFICQNNRK